MNPILEEIYSTILPSAPYIIAAYALVWLALLIYLFMIMRGTKKAQAEMKLLEETLEGAKPSTKDAGEEC